MADKQPRVTFLGDVHFGDRRSHAKIRRLLRDIKSGKVVLVDFLVDYGPREEPAENKT